MKQIKQFSVICFSATFLLSCTAARKTQAPVVRPVDTIKVEQNNTVVPETISTVLSKLNHIDFNTFNGKIDVDYNDDKGKSYSFDVKISMKKNELIWLIATGPFGIEVARALITKDSVKIINKLQKEYIESSISYLQDNLGLPLSLGTMQDLLIGNPVFIDKNNSSYTKGNNALLVSSQTRDFKNLLTVLLPGYLLSTSKLEDVDASKNRSAHLSYQDYRSVGNMNFSTLRNIKVNYKASLDIKLNYKSFNFNQAISTPFSIPGGYKKKS